MAALGMETAQGDFEVIDLCFAGLPPLEKPPVTAPTPPSETWVALASGLSVGASDAPADLRAQLLVEYLMGEGGGIQVSAFIGIADGRTKPTTLAWRG